MSANGFVLASLDRNPRWTEVAGIGADSVQNDPVQLEEGRGAKLEGAIRLKPLLDQLDDGVELSKGVARFAMGEFVGIGDQIGGMGNAVAIAAGRISHRSVRVSRPPCRRSLG
jgi:hypothetical protein